jgi:hypothetical protein
MMKDIIRESKMLNKTMKNKDIIRRKVVCVFGKFDNKSDFVLEPVCKECEEAFWIEKVEKEVKCQKQKKK